MSMPGRPLSTLLAADAAGRRPARRLRLYAPDGPPPPAGWPLLVLLDGDWVWPLAPAPDALARCAVLIPGHDPGKEQTLAGRALDYTPPAPDGGRWPDPRVPRWQCGGADAFLDELLGPMMDWARAQIVIDGSRTSLYGHSYGGLCALYALASRPGAFAHTIGASPSLWWRKGLIGDLLDNLRAAPPTRPLRLTLMAGTHEAWHPQPRDPAAPQARRRGGVPTLPALRALGRRLADIRGLDCRLEPLEGIGHGEALSASARRAIALAAS
ncbi:alpha/beta hydrolase-fold protein [Castellaniella sp. GW247-6E4]|uniref:alpha/beta hydrolase n=1 Tax=Castellaniella sp. GW247-6E4 TaxID=3140380 RepID=UPI00331594DF